MCDVPAPLHITHGVMALEVGGLERLVLGLAKLVRRDGHRVSIICVECPGAMAREVELTGAKVVSLDKPQGRRAEYIGRAEEVLAKLNPDVLHTHTLGAAWYVGTAAGRLRIPVVHTEHGNELARCRNFLARARTRLRLRRSARAIDCFCCVSDEIAAAVTRWRTVPSRKVEVIVNGIDTDTPPCLPPPETVRAELGVPADAQIIGTVGRLVEVKDQAALVRAMKHIHATNHNTQLVLVGDGPERQRLEGLARDAGIAHCVHFTGMQACPEKYLQIMNAFALTSRSEGMPVSLLEAWRAGVPVVSSAVGGIPRAAAHGVNALLYPYGDDEALVDSLQQILRSDELARRLARAGGETLHENYSLARMARRYESIYRQQMQTARRGEPATSR
jgi:glycosyltransferase involved in cell wall biosynthesis